MQVRAYGSRSDELRRRVWDTSTGSYDSYIRNISAANSDVVFLINNITYFGTRVAHRRRALYAQTGLSILVALFIGECVRVARGSVLMLLFVKHLLQPNLTSFLTSLISPALRLSLLLAVLKLLSGVLAPHKYLDRHGVKREKIMTMDLNFEEIVQVVGISIAGAAALFLLGRWANCESRSDYLRRHLSDTSTGGLMLPVVSSLLSTPTSYLTLSIQPPVRLTTFVAAMASRAVSRMLQKHGTFLL